MSVAARGLAASAAGGGGNAPSDVFAAGVKIAAVVLLGLPTDARVFTNALCPRRLVTERRRLQRDTVPHRLSVHRRMGNIDGKWLMVARHATNKPD